MKSKGKSQVYRTGKGWLVQFVREDLVKQYGPLMHHTGFIQALKSPGKICNCNIELFCP